MPRNKTSTVNSGEQIRTPSETAAPRTGIGFSVDFLIGRTTARGSHEESESTKSETESLGSSPEIPIAINPATDKDRVSNPTTWPASGLREGTLLSLAKDLTVSNASLYNPAEHPSGLLIPRTLPVLSLSLVPSAAIPPVFIRQPPVDLPAQHWWTLAQQTKQHQQRFLTAASISQRFSGAEFADLVLSPFRKPKRIRTAFSPSQLVELEHAFEKNHYVVGNERKQLAQSLNLSETQVKVWFQNRRTKHKRIQLDQCNVVSWKQDDTSRVGKATAGDSDAEEEEVADKSSDIND